MSIQTCFQLIDPEQQSSKIPIIANICVDNETISIDLNLFLSCSDFFTKSQKTGSDTIENPAESFPQLYYEAVRKLKVKGDNSQIFLDIIAGYETTFNSNSFFDIFKLAKYFCVPDLLSHLQKTCDMITDPTEIFSVLQKGQISKEEEEYFIKFLYCGHMRSKLSEKINDCFENDFFTSHFPINATFRILKSCKSIDSIPAKKLYELIIQSFEENFRLLPFLDFYRLDDSQKEALCSTFADFAKKVDDNNQSDAASPSSYLLVNKLKLSEMKINDLKWKVESLQIENDQLRRKVSKNQEKPPKSSNKRNLHDASSTDDGKTNKRKRSMSSTDGGKTNQNSAKTSQSSNKRNLHDASSTDDGKINHRKRSMSSTDGGKTNRSRRSMSSTDGGKNNRSRRSTSSTDGGKTNEIEKLKEENDQLKKKNLDVCNDLQQLTSSVDKLKQQAESLRSENDQLKRRIDRKENRSASESKKIEKLREENDQLKEKNSKICNNLQQLTSCIDRLEQQIESLQAENKRLKNLKGEIQKFIERPNSKQLKSGKKSSS